jgi:hypothetical protein
LEIGAADTDGFAWLVVPTGSFGSSVSGLAWVAQSSNTDGGIRIPVRRLDGLVEDGTMPVLDPVFLKIDVEGGEAGVLRGAARLLDHHRPVIYLECQASLLARHGETPARVWDVLREAGYRCFAVRAGVLVPLRRAEPDTVNYVCLPEIDADDEAAPLDLGALEAVLDAWASQTQAG